MQSIARDYWSVWKQFVLQGVTQEDVLPPALMQSWRRCAASGLDPYGEVAQEAETIDGASGVSQHMLALVRPVMEDLHQFVEGSECVVAFADADVCIVDCFGDKDIQEELEHLGLHRGASWREEFQGSNAFSLALQESFPIQLDGAMHYRAALHPLYTSAAPVHDLMGSAVGALGVIGRHEQCHPHTLGMITAAAQAISNQLQMQVWLNNANDLLAELKSILQTLPEGVLLLRNDGVISQMNTPAGAMLGLVPARVNGRRLSDVLPLPVMLSQAITRQQPLTDEEIVFETARGRVTCLCSLRPISNYHTDTSLADIVGSPASVGVIGATGLSLADPVTTDGYVLILRSIERVQRLVNRMTGARARLTFDNVVGATPALKEAMRLALLAARSNSTVLLRGETGTGKEIFAQSIHNSSARVDGPFVAVNCAAIPRELINTELFGYEGGSFTGADRQGRSGKFEQAHGGTLFLDEIGDMPLDLQTALLRAIETRSIVRVGGQRVIPVDVRIIAATHRDLREEARHGNFRSDLFYRLNVLTIHIPALRERAGDIPLLAHHFLQRQSRALGRSLTITPEAMEAIRGYNWPGNIRELENLLERVAYLMPGSVITLADLPLELQQAGEHVSALPARQGMPASESSQQPLALPPSPLAALANQGKA
ncbi:MAG TPA: sigma 54-interacting transcriptional regulator, partial [Ktedonobacteraceae bacterium]|nr:sigma 54-interacting transcriptional regulator [Ktedonobacteraceae bacterium]